MSRRKRSTDQQGQAPVMVTCTDPFHHDEDGYAGRGYHLVGEIVADDREQGGLRWTGRGPEQGPLRTTLPVVWRAAPTFPVKKFRRPDGQPVWRFRCTCGMDVQRPEPELAAIELAWGKAFPGRPCEIDLGRL